MIFIVLIFATFFSVNNQKSCQSILLSNPMVLFHHIIFLLSLNHSFAGVLHAGSVSPALTKLG